MAEEKKNATEKEKDKSEKLIYVLTGLLVIVIFGAIAVLYFNPSTNEKVYKPEKIQIASDMKNISKVETKKEEENKQIDINANSNETNSVSTENTKQEKQIIQSDNQTANQTVEVIPQNTQPVENKVVQEKEKPQKEETSQKVEEKSVNTGTQNIKKEEKKESKTVEVKKAEVKKETPKKVESKKTPKTVVKKKAVKPVKKKETKKVAKKYYYIQISALASMEKARQVKNRLERKGFKNVIIIKEKGLYKVLIGRFSSMKEAFKYIREKNIKGGWVRVLKNPQ